MTKIPNSKFSFKILKKDNKTRARVGEITTAHGVIETPAFVAVGTQGTVKGLSPKDLQETSIQILFGNTYHLHLRPGEDIVKNFGGLGKFMSWNGPTITDSGGFQVFSLGQIECPVRSNPSPSSSATLDNPKLVKIMDDGVEFRSHIDGSKHLFTPEKSIEIQKKLGADLILAFDECAPQPSTYEYTKESMERTHKWAMRSLKASKLKQYHPWQQALYGIIQGGVFQDLREESAKFISNLALSGAEGFDGIAIGGVAVGESKKEMREAVDWSYPFLSENKPRHLLGIGEIDDIFDVIERGMDTFDCVIPTRFGRYGIVFISPPVGNLNNRFRIDLNKVAFAKDQSPLSKDCSCYTCQNFTRGYLHHLFRANELLAYRLASYHNMFFVNNLVKNIRESILKDKFQNFKKEWLD